MKQQDPLPMTMQDFLAWDSGDHLHYELVDGMPRAIMPERVGFGVLKSGLAGLIGNYLHESRPDLAGVMSAGLIPLLLPSCNIRVPDLAVIRATGNSGQGYMREALLLIEILSPSNYSETWSNVWTYSSIPSLREILILHSTRMRAEVLRRGADGTWSAEPEQITQGDLTLDSIGFRIGLAAVYAGTDVTD